MHIFLRNFDEDIPAITPSPIVNEDAPIVTKKNQSNEIRIGPITRARAKLLEQQVNLFLNEPDVFINENFILPKSLYVCMIRFEREEGIARSVEEKHTEHGVLIIQASAREEREAAQGHNEEINT